MHSKAESGIFHRAEIGTIVLGVKSVTLLVHRSHLTCTQCLGPRPFPPMRLRKGGVGRGGKGLASPCAYYAGIILGIIYTFLQ